MRYFLGVDGGGTSTTAYLADQSGKILAAGNSGPSNYQVVGADIAIRSIRDSIKQSCQKVFADGSIRIDAAGFGLAGIDTDKDYQFFFPLIKELEYIKNPVLLNDAYLAVAGGNAAADGLALIAGTGSISVGINKEGRRKRVGGWGYIIDDRGSGYNIAINALHAIFRAHDGRDEETSMMPLFCDFLGITNVEDIINMVYVEKMSRKDIAALARLVFTAASEGDKAAVGIIEKAAEDLAEQVFTVVKDLDMHRSEVVVPLTGGVFKSRNEVLLNTLQIELERLINRENQNNKEYRAENDQRKSNSKAHVKLIEPILHPAAGGILIAMDNAGIKIDEDIITKMKQYG